MNDRECVAKTKIANGHMHGRRMRPEEARSNAVSFGSSGPLLRQIRMFRITFMITAFIRNLHPLLIMYISDRTMAHFVPT